MARDQIKKTEHCYKYLEEVQNFRPENVGKNPEVYRKVQHRIHFFNQRSIPGLSIYKRGVFIGSHIYYDPVSGFFCVPLFSCNRYPGIGS